MSRYIDADALTQSYQRLCSMITCTECPMYNGDGNECEIYLRVKNAPSIDLVRCKECKWADWYKTADGEQYCYCMETGSGGRTADDFCSYGEREGE